MKSPVPGCSILITSAPISPSRPAQNGAAMRVPRSRTRKPSSAPVAGLTSAVPALARRTSRGLRPRTPSPSGSLALARPARRAKSIGGSPRQSQHSLADDVALDLVGACEDRRRLVVEPTALPAAVTWVGVGVAPEWGGGAEHGHGGVVQPFAHLAPVELQCGSFGPELASVLE